MALHSETHICIWGGEGGVGILQNCYQNLL